MEITRRQYLLLELIDALGVIKGRTRMQKLMFLLQKQSDVSRFFEFRPHYYGPYSRELTEMLAALVRAGLVKEDITEKDEMREYAYSVTELGKDLLAKSKQTYEEKSITKAVQVVKKIDIQYAHRAELVDYVYSSYPKESGLSV
jgi:uncharacterized protein YwgA